MHHQWAKTVLKHWEYNIIESKISFCSGQTLRELGLPNFNIICVNKKWLRFLFFFSLKIKVEAGMIHVHKGYLCHTFHNARKLVLILYNIFCPFYPSIKMLYPVCKWYNIGKQNNRRR